jgi:hypothetical protein
MKDVKCVLCVWHVSESHLEWVYSLNHHTMMRFAPQDVPIIWCNFQKLDWLEHQDGDKDSSICTSTAYEGCEMHYKCVTLERENFQWVHSLNHHTHTAVNTQNLRQCPKAWLANWSSSNVVKNYPKAHLHHMKVVKCLRVFHIGVRAILNGCIASTTTICCGSILWS